MTDIGLSLAVLGGIAVLAGVILLMSRRDARKREAALAGYCSEHGFCLATTKEPNARSIRVFTDDWRLTGSMRASASTAQSGSAEWERKTEWICTRQNPLRPVFALQVSNGATDFECLPDWVREAALAAIRSQIGESLQPLSSVRTAFCENGRCGVLFERENRSAESVMERLYAPLGEWCGGLPLYLECSPERARLTLTNVALKDAKELEAILRIALQLI